MAQALPNPRLLLTALLSSLPQPNAPSSSHQHPAETDPSTSISRARTHNPHLAGNSPNPLRQIPPAYRPLLTTLHVLYPSTFLPALDLLDRHLVTRVVLKKDSSERQQQNQHQLDLELEEEEEEEDTHAQSPVSNRTEKKRRQPSVLYHLVRSAAAAAHTTKGKGSDNNKNNNSGGGTQAYIVRTQAWSCSCAVFAFAAFPPLPLLPPKPPADKKKSTGAGSPGGYEISPSTTMRNWDREQRNTGEEGQEEEEAETWEFGGLSADGKDSDAEVEGGGSIQGRSEIVPCCKHLLACVLAERWAGMLGTYVQERVVSREEAAGLVGDL
ncbi:hypothetical protein F5Y16DRAFT_403365 [Xylariaceae sp. FL0255]|nr:hypothetical protein F5Y16DRAFT_403365 [Xylariaceae sp. FL0255]